MSTDYCKNCDLLDSDLLAPAMLRCVVLMVKELESEIEHSRKIENSEIKRLTRLTSDIQLIIGKL